MDDEFTYVNSCGDSVAFGGDAPCWIEGDALRGYEHAYTIIGGGSPSFYRKPIERSVTVCYDLDQGGKDGLDAMLDVFSHDVDAKTPGRMYADGWYIGCCVIAAEDNYDESYLNHLACYNVTILITDPVWTREHEQRFWRSDSGGDGDALDYPYDYPHDYRSHSNRMTLKNPGIAAAPLKLVVYGPASLPRVVIGGNVYEVDVPLDAGDILTIDGLSCTIMRRRNNGTLDNVFSRRRGVQKKGSGSFVFEPVSPGLSEISWDGSFGFDAVVCERRSERGWAK